MNTPHLRQSPEARLIEEMMERYTSALNRYIQRRVRNPQDADDMVQEIFARFLRKKDRPEVLRNPFGYLLGFARNVLLESAGRDDSVIYDSDLVDAASRNAEDATVEPLADRIGTSREIASALSKLPEAQLLAITLVDGHGMSYEEAARASGFTRTTIATYVMHARATLRQVLPGYWKGPTP